MKVLTNRLLSLVGGRLARNSILVMLLQGMRLIALAAWVIIVARALGAEGYGLFAGVAGLGVVISGFAGLGLGYLMYQKTAVDPVVFSKYWHHALLAYILSGLALAVAFVLIACALFPSVEISILAMIAVSEVVAFPLVTTAAFAFAAHERMGWSAGVPTIAATARLIAGCVLLATEGEGSLARYVVYHMGANLLAGAIAIICVIRVLKPGSVSDRIGRSDIAESFGYSFLWFSGNALGSWDKTLVLKFGGDSVAGLYASAYRAATLFALPIDSAIMSAMPRLFRHGAGVGQSQRLIAALLVAVVGYGCLAAVAIWHLAALLPVVLGASFSGMVTTLQWLGLLVPIYGLRQLAGQILIASRGKRYKAAIDLGGLALLTLLAAVLVSAWGLMGGVAAAIFVEAYLAVTSWWVVLARPEKALSAPLP